MNLVVDASVALKWFFGDNPGEQDSGKAREILSALASRQIVLVQPPHWVAEILAVVARQTPHLAAETLAILLSTSCRLADDEIIYSRACELSSRLKQHLFDTLYHAVAIENDATLVTADERYFAIARGEGKIELLHSTKLR